jgi:hypothetical protein
MSVQQTDVIDFVTHHAKSGRLILVMVESREWGDSGELLPELQAKFNTYVDYVIGGRLTCDYPAYAFKTIGIELRTQHRPTSREKEFLDIVAADYLKPLGIAFDWRLIGARHTIQP